MCCWHALFSFTSNLSAQLCFLNFFILSFSNHAGLDFLELVCVAGMRRSLSLQIRDLNCVSWKFFILNFSYHGGLDFLFLLALTKMTGRTTTPNTVTKSVTTMIAVTIGTGELSGRVVWGVISSDKVCCTVFFNCDRVCSCVAVVVGCWDVRVCIAAEMKAYKRVGGLKCVATKWKVRQSILKSACVRAQVDPSCTYVILYTHHQGEYNNHLCCISWCIKGAYIAVCWNVFMVLHIPSQL